MQSLTTLTIPRLQALLKASRAAYMARITCHCGCGERLETLYGVDYQDVKDSVHLKERYEAVKAELKRRQK